MYERGEVVQRQRERREVRSGNEPSRIKLVERGARVGERLPFDEQLVRLVAEEAAGRDRDQHAEQRQVEQQVADLAQVPLLRRHPVARTVMLWRVRGRPPQPEPLPAEHCGGTVDRRRRRQRGGVGRRVRQACEIPRCARRWRPSRTDKPEGTGHDAPDKRREEQQVDRREPRRGEHVEEIEPVQPGCQLRMRGVVLLHRAGSVPSCGRIEPGTEPSASRNSRISAVRMEVSCRHPQRSPAGTRCCGLAVPLSPALLAPNEFVASPSPATDSGWDWEV